MPLDFRSSTSMTLGAEIELQLIDPETKDLTPAAPSVLERLRPVTTKVKPELFRSMLEISTDVCHDVRQVRADLLESLMRVREVTDTMNVQLACSGSHPFARHSQRIIYPSARYADLIDRNRWLARRFMVFGLHVHVGMRDGNHAIAMLNAMLQYQAHLLALSASSPFWQGTDTGLASCRITVYEALPTAGHPCTFDDWDSFSLAYQAMVESRAIASIKDIWWDIRPHPDIGTVEVRVCDAPPTFTRLVALVALVQSLFAWFDQRYRDGEPFPAPPYWVMRENKWRASRWGLDADIVLDASGRTANLKDEIFSLLERLAPLARTLRCAEELASLGGDLEASASYRRQRQVAEETGSLPAVVSALAAELEADTAMPAAPS
ncbi:MAG TPA: glutamate--cysteine ligase [Gemmatimonadales bacterium]|nr:glutamate--cysteine ligase [Gemmatimonadales bacterium]